MSKIQKLTTRGIATATAIRDREPFTTHGALAAGRLRHFGSGQLRGDDLDRWFDDYEDLDYVVYSYATPIAWHTTSTGWYRVKAKFSMTTSHHQGNLYLIEAGS